MINKTFKNQLNSSKTTQIDYNSLISLSSLKKSFLIVTQRWKNSENFSKTVSLKDIIKLHELLKKNKFYPPIINKKIGKKEMITLILLEAVKGQLSLRMEPELSTFAFGYRPLLTENTGLNFIEKRLNAPTWFVKLNLSTNGDTFSDKLFFQKLQHYTDNKTFVLIKHLYAANYIDLQKDFHNLNFFLKKTTPSEKIVEMLSPLLITFFYKDLDTFLTTLMNKKKLKKSVESKKGEHKSLFLLSPFQKNNPNSESKYETNKEIFVVRYLNCYFFFFKNNFYEAEQLYTQIKQFLKTEYNLNFFPALKSTKQTQKNPLFLFGFNFIFSKEHNIQISLPLENIKKFLTNKKLLTQDTTTNTYRPSAVLSLVNKSDKEIIFYFSNLIKAIFLFYKKDTKKLKTIFALCRTSCALTLAIKYKLKSPKLVYKKFTNNLAIICPQTNKSIKLFYPNNFS